MNQQTENFMQRRLRMQGPRQRFQSRPHDVQNIYVSLKQWRILHAVIDCGGYAEAAKTLHLSQSTISYTVAKLQEQLGVSLLRIEGRKAVLTAEGRALLDRSRQVLKEAIELEKLARSMGQGWGGEVRLVVDQNFPTDLLMQALSKFHSIGQGAAQVRLREVGTLPAEDILRDHSIDLVISERVPLGFLGEPLAEVEYIPVARSSHPLLQLGKDASPMDLFQHVEIGIGRSGDSHHNGMPPGNARVWAMNSFETALAAVQEELGYAWLPEHRVRGLLDDGKLARVPLADKRSYKTVFYLIHGRPYAATPATARFADVLRGIVIGNSASHSMCAAPASSHPAFSH